MGDIFGKRFILTLPCNAQEAMMGSIHSSIN